MKRLLALVLVGAMSLALFGCGKKDSGNANLAYKMSISFSPEDSARLSYEEALKIAVNRHDISVIRVYDPRELTLPSVGLVHAKDSESGASAWVNTSSKAVRRAYSKWMSDSISSEEKLLLKYNVDSVSVATDGDYVKSLMALFQRR